MKYKLSVTLDTNYSKEELVEVINNLFSIPESQYEDCEKFKQSNIKILQKAIKKAKGKP